MIIDINNYCNEIRHSTRMTFYENVCNEIKLYCFFIRENCSSSSPSEADNVIKWNHIDGEFRVNNQFNLTKKSINLVEFRVKR